MFDELNEIIILKATNKKWKFKVWRLSRSDKSHIELHIRIKTKWLENLKAIWKLNKEKNLCSQRKNLTNTTKLIRKLLTWENYFKVNLVWWLCKFWPNFRSNNGTNFGIVMVLESCDMLTGISHLWFGVIEHSAAPKYNGGK